MAYEIGTVDDSGRGRGLETRVTDGLEARVTNGLESASSNGSETRFANDSDRGGVIETGTTTLAVAGRDGVVLAADTRASIGGGKFVTNRTVQKIEPIGDHAAVAFSGSVSDAQAFVERLRAESRLYELRHGGSERIPLETLATLAGGLVRDGPYRLLDLILAGVAERSIGAGLTGDDGGANDDGGADDNGGTDDALEPAVYDIGPGGGVLATDYAASGSGMQLAYGALEGSIDPSRSTSVERLRPVAAEAVRSATARDTASGDGLTIVTIAGTTDPESGGVDVSLELETVDLDALEHGAGGGRSAGVGDEGVDTDVCAGPGTGTDLDSDPDSDHDHEEVN